MKGECPPPPPFFPLLFSPPPPPPPLSLSFVFLLWKGEKEEEFSSFRTEFLFCLEGGKGQKRESRGEKGETYLFVFLLII